MSHHSWYTHNVCTQNVFLHIVMIHVCVLWFWHGYCTFVLSGLWHCKLSYTNLGTRKFRVRPRNRWQDEVREDGRIVGGKGGRKKYITERNGRSSWEWQGIVAYCTHQWNEWMKADSFKQRQTIHVMWLIVVRPVAVPIQRGQHTNYTAIRCPNDFGQCYSPNKSHRYTEPCYRGTLETD